MARERWKPIITRYSINVTAPTVQVSQREPPIPPVRQRDRPSHTMLHPLYWLHFRNKNGVVCQRKNMRVDAVLTSVLTHKYTIMHKCCHYIHYKLYKLI